MVASPIPSTSTGILATAELIDTTQVDLPVYVSINLNSPFSILNSVSSLTFATMAHLISGTTSILYISCTSFLASSTCFTTFSTENPLSSLNTSLHDKFQMYSRAYLSFLIFSRTAFTYSLQLVNQTCCCGRTLLLPMILQMSGMMVN